MYRFQLISEKGRQVSLAYKTTEPPKNTVEYVE